MALTDISTDPRLQFQNKILGINPGHLAYLTLFMPVSWPTNGHTAHLYLLKYQQSFNIYSSCADQMPSLGLCADLILPCIVIQLHADPCLIPSIQSFLRPTTVSYFALTLNHLPHAVSGHYLSAKLKQFPKLGHGIENYLPCCTRDEERRCWGQGSKNVGLNLSSAFYKMSTRGNIFTFLFSLPKAQFPHL